MAGLMGLIAKTRDRRAFGEIFEYYGPRVKAFLMSRRMAAHEADELAQEVMLTVWNKAHLYAAEKASVSTWIFTIARNRMIDLRRSEGRKAGLDIHDPALHPAAEPQPDETLARSDEDRAVAAALKELPKEQSDILRLSFMEGHSHHTIAARLDLPLGTVKSRIRLAKDRLKSVYEDLR